MEWIFKGCAIEWEWWEEAGKRLEDEIWSGYEKGEIVLSSAKLKKVEIGERDEVGEVGMEGIFGVRIGGRWMRFNDVYNRWIKRGINYGWRRRMTDMMKWSRRGRH